VAAIAAVATVDTPAVEVDDTGTSSVLVPELVVAPVASGGGAGVELRRLLPSLSDADTDDIDFARSYPSQKPCHFMHL
jgi:hypothetical protein